MKKETAIRILSSLLILLFTYAALSKLADHAVFQDELRKFPGINISPAFFSWLIPASELVVVILLIIPKLNFYGLYAGLSLLVLFTIFLILMISFDKHLPCACGGVISKLTWSEHVVFNLFFILLSITCIRFHKRIHRQQINIKSLLQ